MNRKYVAVLAAIAILILAAGLSVRRVVLRTQAPTAAPPSEGSALQQLSERSQLRRTSDFVAARIAAVAPFVEYVAAAGSTGLRWGRGDSVLTTDVTWPIIVVRVPSHDSARAPALTVSDSVPGDMMLVVGRGPDGHVISTTTTPSGRAVSACAGASVARIVLHDELDDAFAGAALFDLDGRTVGMVVRCGGRLAALPVQMVKQLLDDDGSAAGRVRDAYGLVVAAPDARLRAYFGIEGGLVVTGVELSSPMASHVRAGDVILSLDGNPVASVDDLRPLVAPDDSSEHTIVRRRGTVVSMVPFIRRAPRHAERIPANDMGIAIAPAPSLRGIRIDVVRPGSAADKAGLEPGDQLVRVGDQAVTTVAAARRLLAARTSTPTFIVFERAGFQHGVMIAP